MIDTRADRKPDAFALTAGAHSFHTRAYLKVQDGCNARCSYCRVPLARGPSTSLAPQEAVRRAAELEEAGHREIIITGVNISLYRSGGITLPELLGRLLDGTRHARFRLSSLEPESITESLAAVMAHPRICPHFHVPVQSGADGVFARMKRPYRADGVAAAIARVRAAKNDPFLAADIIVGFPGETVDDFAATSRIVTSMEFAALHVFPFSPRPGTVAATMRPIVPEHVRFQRTKELMDLSRRSSAAYTRSWVGRDVEVLVEGRKAQHFKGVTGNYLKLDVKGSPTHCDITGRLINALITAEDTARFLSFAE